MSASPLPPDDNTPLWRLRLRCLICAVGLGALPGDPHPPLWRARLVIVLFVFGWLVSFGSMKNSSNLAQFVSGLFLTASGVGALVWRDEFAEQNRRLREGSWFQVSYDEYRRAAVWWGSGLVLFGVVTVTTALAVVLGT